MKLPQKDSQITAELNSNRLDLQFHPTEQYTKT